MADFRILTLDWTAFDNACRELRESVQAAGFTPDVVISIPRGGDYIQQHGWPDMPHYAVSLKRPYRPSPKKAAARVLKFLPLAMRDRLRIWDAGRLVKKSGHMAGTEIILPVLDPAAFCVLIVDDAVDSGATLSAVYDKLSRRYPAVTFRCAALTVTADKPVRMPDYYLYHNSTLVRMPWSIDSK